jgi:hypothetical protein
MFLYLGVGFVFCFAGRCVIDSVRRKDLSKYELLYLLYCGL